MTDDELINDFVSRVAKDEITFDKIRPLLEERGIDEVRIKQIVRRVDDEIQKSLLTKSASTSVDQAISLGVVLFVIGAILAISSFAGLFSLRNSYMAIITYGSLIGGLVLIVGGMRRKKKKNLTPDSDTLNRRFRLRDRMKNNE